MKQYYCLDKVIQYFQRFPVYGIDHEETLVEQKILIPSLMNIFNESRFPNVDWDNLKTFMKPDNDNVVSMDQFRPTP